MGTNPTKAPCQFACAGSHGRSDGSQPRWATCVSAGADCLLLSECGQEIPRRDQRQTGLGDSCIPRVSPEWERSLQRPQKRDAGLQDEINSLTGRVRVLRVCHHGFKTKGFRRSESNPTPWRLYSEASYGPDSIPNATCNPHRGFAAGSLLVGLGKGRLRRPRIWRQSEAFWRIHDGSPRISSRALAIADLSSLDVQP
jgi:hypothetical protein